MRPYSYLGRLAVLGGLLAVAAPLAPGGARAADVDIFFKEKRGEKKEIANLRLQPNAGQQFYLYLRNNTKKDLANAAVVVKVRGGELPVEINRQAIEGGLKANDDARWVVLGKPAAAEPGKGPPLTPLEGNELEVTVVNGSDKALSEPSVITVNNPRAYVEVEGATFYPGGNGQKNRLEVKVKKKADFIGDRSRIELDLRSDRIPALVEGQKKQGTYSGYLTAKNSEMTLVAEDLQFKPGADRTGLVYLRIDGVERAFTFYATFAGDKPTQLNPITAQPILRINASPVAASAPAAKVGVEIDNSRDGQEAELGLFRSATFEEREGELLIFRGDRRTRLSFNPAGPDGAMLFKTEVQDWSTDLDVKEVFGRRVLRLRLLAGGNEVPVIDSSKKIELLGDRFREVPFVVFGYLLDGSKPEGVKFVKEAFPENLVRGEPIPVTAAASDPESDIKEVLFFVGKPTPEGNPPQNAVQAEGRPVKDKPGTWAAELPAPTDRRATYLVSVKATNGVGLSAIDTIEIKLVDAGKDGAGGAGKGSIEGKVVVGDRPQEGLDVFLTDAEGKLKGTTKTKKDGSFEFKDLKEGAYKVSSAKSAEKVSGAVDVAVGPNEKKKDVEVKLTR